MAQFMTLNRLFDKYTELVSENPHIVRNVESGLRMLSYIVPGSGDGGTVLSEMLYASSSLLTMLHDSIYRKVADIKWKVHVPHRQLMTWLTVLEHVEVFLELTAGTVSSAHLRWLIIVCVHVAKAAVRFLLLLKHNSGIQVSPLLPPLNRTEVKGHLHKGPNLLGDAGSASPTTGAASIPPQKATFTLERSGRTIRSLAAAPPMSERCWKVPMPQTAPSEVGSAEVVYQPSQLTQKQLLGETLHVIRPLAHLLSLYLFGLKSWKPWLLSCAVDASSLLCLGDPGLLNPAERMELRRRALLMVLYLLRSPFYDRCTRIRLFCLLKLVEHNVPLSSLFMKALINYIPPWQRTYFYVWMS
ncbi:hypothetical protein NP493_8g08014 [Ridgeia piscesae]|uniref:Peroxisomal membrane protein PEX16 n=1 Tax=Ridgeia piscesae TaxID=27915 RepID=A0AAD9PFN0_RIDPI|nr:hypothetical protein NP493_8g08014 [Ridgeia piscesae]